MRILSSTLMLIVCLFLLRMTTYVSLHRPERILVPLQQTRIWIQFVWLFLKELPGRGGQLLKKQTIPSLSAIRLTEATRYPIIAIDYSLYAVDFHYASSYNLSL